MEKNTARRAAHAGDGPVEPRRLVARRWRPPRQRQLRLEDRRSITASTSNSRSSSITCKGRGDGKFPKAWVFETGTNQWRTLRRMAARAAKPTDHLSSDANGTLSLAAARGRPHYDEYVSDPAKPVPYIGRIAPRHAVRLHDRRPALRRRAPRRAGLPDRAARTRRDHLRPHPSILEGLHHRHRFRFRREADRRLSRRLPRLQQPAPTLPRPATAVAPMGGYQQLVRGEPFRGKFRKSFEKPEPFEPGKPRPHRVRPCPISPHLPPRPSHHGADPELLVPADGPQSAEVHGHSQSPEPPISQKATERVYLGGPDGSRITLRIGQ